MRPVKVSRLRAIQLEARFADVFGGIDKVPAELLTPAAHFRHIPRTGQVSTLVVVESDDGAVGYGEAFGLPHAGAGLDEAELTSPRSFDPHLAYARSKQANVLFAVGLARRLDPARVTSNSLEPGVIATKMLRQGFGMSGGGSLAQGAATSVFAATSERVAGVTGHHFARSNEARASFVEADVEPLWELSDRLCARWL